MTCQTDIERVLTDTRSIAVVGLSSNPDRDSHRVAAYLQGAGYRVLPVNPREDEILGEKCYFSLKNIPDEVDLVNVFRSPEHLPEIVEDALEIEVKSLWTQLGIVHQEATDRARRAGLCVIVDKCVMVEHQKITLSEDKTEK